MEDIIVNNKITVPASAVEIKFSRSSGKGGQNVNKVSTKVELLVDVDLIIASDRTKQRIRAVLANKLDQGHFIRIISQESRSQWQNRRTAVDKLMTMVEEAAKEQRERFATKPTRSSKVRRIETKKKEGKKKVFRRKSFLSNDD